MTRVAHLLRDADAGECGERAERAEDGDRLPAQQIAWIDVRLRALDERVDVIVDLAPQVS